MKKITIKNKLLILLSFVFIFISFFAVSTFAYHVDSNGNLVSDNLQPVNDKSSSSIGGVTWSISNQTLYLNGTSTSGSWQNITTNSFTLEAGTYTIQWFTNYTGNNIGFGAYNNSTGLDNLYQLNTNRYKIFTISEETTFTIVCWWQSSGIIFDNIYIRSMIYSGSYDSNKQFESYGSVYYSQSSVDTLTTSSFGAYAFIENITFKYNNGSEDIVYGSYNSIIDFVQVPFVQFYNSSLRIRDSRFLSEVGGNSNYSYSLDITFKQNSVRVGVYTDWYLYGNFSFFYFSNGSNSFTSSATSANPFVINLISDYSWSSSDYISHIMYTRSNPNIGLSYSMFGTPVDSANYNSGYNTGYQTAIDTYMRGVYEDSQSYSSGYDDGYQTAINEYNGIVFPTSNSYSAGYELGRSQSQDSSYTAGYSAGYAKARADSTWIASDNSQANVTDLIWSIGATPWESFKNIWNVNFLGVNIANIVTGLVTALIVIYLIKKVWK